MSHFKNLAIEQQNDCMEIAEKLEAAKKCIEVYQFKYAHFFPSEDTLLSEGEKAFGCRLHINAGIVGIIENSPKQLIVQFR